MLKLPFFLGLVASARLVFAQIEDSDDEDAYYPTTSTDYYPNPAPAPTSPYYDGVWAKVSSGVITECKTCPYSLCPNKGFYPSMLMFRATCWTNGEKINDTE